MYIVLHRQRDPRALFESLDVDGNGRLDQNEICELCRQLGELRHLLFSLEHALQYHALVFDH